MKETRTPQVSSHYFYFFIWTLNFTIRPPYFKIQNYSEPFCISSSVNTIQTILIVRKNKHFLFDINLVVVSFAQSDLIPEYHTVCNDWPSNQTWSFRDCIWISCFLLFHFTYEGSEGDPSLDSKRYGYVDTLFTCTSYTPLVQKVFILSPPRCVVEDLCV